MEPVQCILFGDVLLVWIKGSIILGICLLLTHFDLVVFAVDCVIFRTFAYDLVTCI